MVEHANELPDHMLTVCIDKITYFLYVLSHLCSSKFSKFLILFYLVVGQDPFSKIVIDSHKECSLLIQRLAQ